VALAWAGRSVSDEAPRATGPNEAQREGDVPDRPVDQPLQAAEFVQMSGAGETLRLLQKNLSQGEVIC
jgi:hypothetical protein